MRIKTEAVIALKKLLSTVRASSRTDKASLAAGSADILPALSDKLRFVEPAMCLGRAKTSLLHEIIDGANSYQYAENSRQCPVSDRLREVENYRWFHSEDAHKDSDGGTDLGWCEGIGQHIARLLSMPWR